MATSSYIVKSPIKHGGERHAVDSIVDLDDKVAKSLIESGDIEKVVTHTAPSAPTDDAVRLAAIKEAIGKLNVDNGDLWLKDGRPDVKALEGITGWKVSAGERDTAWEAVKPKA